MVIKLTISKTINTREKPNKTQYYFKKNEILGYMLLQTILNKF